MYNRYDWVWSIDSNYSCKCSGNPSLLKGTSFWCLVLFTHSDILVNSTVRDTEKFPVQNIISSYSFLIKSNSELSLLFCNV